MNLYYRILDILVCVCAVWRPQAVKSEHLHILRRWQAKVIPPKTQKSSAILRKFIFAPASSTDHTQVNESPTTEHVSDRQI